MQHGRLAKLDESADYRRLRPVLEKAGFRATTVDEQGLKGAPDQVVVQHAGTEQAVLITLDPDMADMRRDFVRAMNCTVVVLRPGRYGPEMTVRMLERLLRYGIPDVPGTVISVKPTGWRVVLPVEGEHEQ